MGFQCVGWKSSGGKVKINLHSGVISMLAEGVIFNILLLNTRLGPGLISYFRLRDRCTDVEIDVIF
jgi:hypothetical protein